MSHASRSAHLSPTSYHDITFTLFVLTIRHTITLTPHVLKLNCSLNPLPQWIDRGAEKGERRGWQERVMTKKGRVAPPVNGKRATVKTATVITATVTRKLCYHKDDRAMHAI